MKPYNRFLEERRTVTDAYGVRMIRPHKRKARRRFRFGPRHFISKEQFDPLYGSNRWVCREWPDDWRPFHAGVMSKARKFEDWVFRMRLRALAWPH